MKELICTALYLAGLFALNLAAIYFLAMIMYAFGADASLPDMVYMPKWILLLAPLVLLGNTKSIESGIQWIIRRTL
jgi:hypothetical protein